MLAHQLYVLRRYIVKFAYWTVNRPMWVYASTYLLAIPLFALFYTFIIPSDFYHATAKYERANPSDYGPVMQAIWQDLFTRNYVNLEKQIDCLNKTFVVDSYGISGDRKNTFRLSLGLKMREGDTYQDPSKYLIITLIYDSIYCEFILDCTILARVDPFSVLVFKDLGVNASELARCIFKDSIIDIDSDGNLKCVASPDLARKLIDYWGGLEGFPHRLSYHFFRMLYLSAVTITTLGYGDIVPITTAARMAIAIEAIMGIILIGLFLNAVAKKNR
jgi:hypothetical protein